jgi:ankyrin repeat protein
MDLNRGYTGNSMNAGIVKFFQVLLLLLIIIISSPACSPCKNNTSGECLLRYARLGSVEGVRRNIEAGVNINYRGEVGDTALMNASSELNADVVEYLLRKKAKVNLKDQSGDTAFRTCCSARSDIIHSVRPRFNRMYPTLLNSSLKTVENR